ncbi:serine/threonine protein kinase [Minicystis rosea]|nr:serine/threonine protein kinase [Minicystis rosea]
MRFEPGSQIDRYTIEAIIGEGGMGRVCRAFDTRLHRRVALKVLHLVEGADAADAVTSALREARAAAAIAHPNATAVYDADEIDGLPYIVMEFVPGTSLRQIISGPPVPMSLRLRWLLDIAGALGAAHQVGIIHRDVKPENVMVREDGLVKVLDFGVARRTIAGNRTHDSQPSEQNSTPDGSGRLVGTPAYMPPEQIRGEPIDGRADQFAWGVLAYELLTGHLPWKTAREFLGYIAAVLTERPEPPRTLTPEIPAAVEAAVLRALAKNPQNRFATIALAAAELVPFAQDTLTGAVPSLPPERMSAPPERVSAAPAERGSGLPAIPERAPPRVSHEPNGVYPPVSRAAEPTLASTMHAGALPAKQSALPSAASFRADSVSLPRQLPSPPPSRPASPPPPPRIPPPASSDLHARPVRTPSPLSARDVTPLPEPVSSIPPASRTSSAPVTSPPSMPMPSVRRTLPEGYQKLREPRFDTSIDIEAHIAMLPADATCKGMFFIDLLRMGARVATPAELFRAAQVPERRHTSFRDYPAAENLRLTVAVAKAVYPRVPLGEGLRRLGHMTFDHVLGTHMGRSTLGILGPDIDKMLVTGPKMFKHLVNFGKVTCEQGGPHTYLYRAKEFPVFLETFGVGVLEGALRHCRAQGKIRVSLDDLASGLCEVRVG